MPSVNLIIKDFVEARIDHALKRLPILIILLPNSDLELAGWLLLSTAARSGSPQIMPCIRLVIIIIYRLRTFNSSMWGLLRLAPII